jgi:hypothetical protein
MSSIYRKGRDGYFYYQTYLKNPKSGKIDKKVFHSLGTKNRKEAERKKNIYDQRYSLKKISFKWNKLLVSTFIFTSSIALYLFFYPNKQNIDYSNSKNNIDKIFLTETIVNKDTSAIYQNNEKLRKKKISNEEAPVHKFSEEILIKDSLIENRTLYAAPYTIHRFEVLSNSFEQAKIYATVKEEYNDDVLQLSCEKIRNEYKKFSNVIICLYLENETGVSISKGLKRELSPIEESKIWLAMYSYNPVEGAFYNGNPSGYLIQQ